jgi:heme/copper-type cytochrome/quinol oxidase subunit 4
MFMTIGHEGSSRLFFAFFRIVIIVVVVIERD